MAPEPSDTAGATPRDHLLASLWLCLMLLLLGLVVVPLLRELPLGSTTKTLLLAWVLVAMAMYWMYAGLGFQPLLLAQLGFFCLAALLLSTKAGLVLVGIERFSILRRIARVLILSGAGLAAINLLALILLPIWRGRRVTDGR
ncbi:MAG: hypothetical protein M3Y31_01850 [Gemmatimonadota bacterium]|nr:hypothetical protein [Gemmatimonadota bacterium]